MIEQSPLPFDITSLEPYMSKRTLEFHYGKHHAAYIKKTNELIAGTDLENATLETIVVSAYKNKNTALFNQSAQALNHEIFWKSLRANVKMSNIVKTKIESDFGSYDKFVDEFTKSAMGQFGSGWTWLILDGNKMKIVSTSNAETPIVNGFKPLLALDVWEHSYYLDYQNLRADYIKNFLTNIANWDYVEENIK